MWRQQYKKELMANRAEALFLLGFYALWTVWLLSRAGVWEPEAVIALYIAPLSGILPLWALWTSVQLYRQEWRENTSYLMLSLPVRAWKITSAKLAALLTGVLALCLLSGAGLWLLMVRTGLLAELFGRNLFALVPLEWLVRVSLLAFGGMLAGLVVLALFTQLAYVFSRLFTRFRGLVMLWTWALSFWLLIRVGDLGSRLLGFLPDFRLRMLSVRNGVPEFEVLTIDSGPFVAIVLLLFGLYWLLNAVLERAIEV